MKKPILIATLGFPGSGKTYFSERLAKEKKFYHLSADQVRWTMFEKPAFTKDESDMVRRTMNLIAEKLLGLGISVVYDANVNFRANRKKMAAMVRKYGATFGLVWIKTDVAVAEKRLVKRSAAKGADKNLLYRPLDVKILHLLKDEMEHPTKSEPVIVIDGHALFETQLATLKKSIKF